MRKISLFQPYIPVLLVYGYILELWYMQNHQAGTATVSFYIFTFNHVFIHFYSLFYNDFFYEFIAMFSTKKMIILVISTIMVLYLFIFLFTTSTPCFENHGPTN